MRVLLSDIFRDGNFAGLLDPTRAGHPIHRQNNEIAVRCIKVLVGRGLSHSESPGRPAAAPPPMLSAGEITAMKGDTDVCFITYS